MRNDEGPILVVEDDDDLASLVAESLDTVGIRSVVAHNGREALDAIEREAPSAILLDLMMPVMDGWQFREEQLKRRGAAAVPLIVVTADGHAEDKARELKADGYLGKPASLEELVAEVERVKKARAGSSAQSSGTQAWSTR